MESFQDIKPQLTHDEANVGIRMPIDAELIQAGLNHHDPSVMVCPRHPGSIVTLQRMPDMLAGEMEIATAPRRKSRRSVSKRSKSTTRKSTARKSKTRRSTSKASKKGKSRSRSRRSKGPSKAKKNK